MFGNNSFGNTSFGSTTFGAGFGAAPTLGTFGASTQASIQPSGPIGTTVRFVPLSGTDTVQKTGTNTGGPSQITTRHQNISAMKEYETKSVEELRLEDYAANRKVGQPQTAFNSTPFSSMQPSTSQQNTSIFGTNTQPTPNLFASPSQNQATNIFGQQKTGFDLNNTSNIFSSSLNKPNTTVSNSPFQIGTPFNSNTSTTGGQASFPLFNSNAQTNTTTFGASAVNSPFKTNMFASPTSTPNLFSAPAQEQTTNIFGQQKTGFDLNNTSNIFSSSLNKPNTTVSNSPFQIGTPFNANTSTASGQTGFPMFNNNAQTNATTFGAPAVNSPFKTNMFASPTATSNLFAAPTKNQTTNILGQPKTGFELNNTSSIFSSSLNKPNTTVSNSPFQIGTPFNSNTSTTGGQTSFPLFNNNAQTTTTTFGASAVNSPFKTNMFASPSSTSNLFAAPTQDQSTNIFGQPKTGFEMNNSSSLFSSSLNKPNTTVSNSPFQMSTPFNTNNSTTSGQAGFPLSQSPDLLLNRLKTLPYGETSLYLNDTSTSPSNGSRINFTTDPTTINMYKMTAKKNVKLNKPATEKIRANSVLFDGLDDTSDDLRCAIDIFVPKKSVKQLELKPGHNLSESENNHHNNSSGFISTRPDYVIRPSIDEIERNFNSQDDTCFVDSLYIERQNYGSILFESQVNVKGLNLDEIVHIRRKEVVVYPDDENKPPVGQGLNRPAIITLHQVWPVDKSNNEVIRDVNRLKFMKYPEKIESATVEKGARFIEYKPETGSWKFSVSHFSKYGITDDDEDFNSSQPQPTKPCAVNPPSISSSPLIKPSITVSDSPTQTDTTFNSNSSTPSGLNGFSLAQSPVLLSDRERSSIGLKTLPYGETSLFLNDTDPSPGSGEKTNFINDSTTTINMYKMTAKKSVKLNKSISEKTRANSVLFDGSDDLSDDLRYGTKRLALQNVSLNISSTSYERPITVGATVPKQQKVREIKLKPDLYAAQNKFTRDIMSVCVAGSPKVRFFNGSRKFCYIQGDNVVIHELNLVPTSTNGTLADDIREKFEYFLENNSIVTSLNMNPTLAPYIETYDFISNASSRNLLYALYGNLSSKTPYAKQDERLTRVISWLAAVNRKLPPPTNLYQLIIYHMSCDRYDLASTLAIENNHPRLALLVATLNLNKGLMIEQLSSWRLSTADQYIDHELLKIYVLLSGSTEWKLSNDVTVYCLKGLKWTQQLCLLSLHVTSLLSEPQKYGFHMLPKYIERLDTNTNDVNYHILARHSPANILSAADTLIEEWLLLESLKSFRVINSESECINSDVIHCNLASQLGPIDLRWACFVALHIINNEVRNQVLISCLEQNQEQLHNTESWLIEKLKVPTEFIENSKSLARKSY